jgi:EF hand
MKPTTATALAAALGLSLLAAMVPAKAQTADCNPPPGPAMDDRDDGPDGGRGGDRHDRHHGGRGMMIIDVNGDGVIGADEAAALADGAFQHMDRNGDGTLDQAEFTTLPGHDGGWMRGWFNSAEIQAVQKLRADRFAALDADKDGKVTKVEFFADAQAKLASADADKDGKVTPWEFRALPRM